MAAGTLGERLKTARESLGVSAKDFAARLEIDPSAISRWETGRVTPRPDWVERLAAALNVTPAWLMFGGEEGGPELPRATGTDAA